MNLSENEIGEFIHFHFGTMHATLRIIVKAIVGQMCVRIALSLGCTMFSLFLCHSFTKPLYRVAPGANEWQHAAR